MHACSVASVESDSLWPKRLQPTRLLCSWDFPGKNTGVGCHAALQGIFLTGGLNSHLPASPALQADSFTQLSHLGSPYIQVELSKYSLGPNTESNLPQQI